MATATSNRWRWRCSRGRSKLIKNTLPRFWKFVTVSPECWEWAGHKTYDGYGVFHLSRESRPRRIVAHRFAWQSFNGVIPIGLKVCHRCDNPSCVRPDHLFLATPSENQQDCIAKERRPNDPSVALPKLSWSLARKIRRNWIKVPIHHLALRLSVSRKLIRKVRQGIAWKGA